MTIQTSFTVTSEAELNAAIAAIDLGGTSSAANTSYTITITSDLILNANIAAINLAIGDTLDIQGNNPGNDHSTAQIDGNGTRRGFVVTAGSVFLNNMALTGMTAPGGTLGNPAGGGALYVGANASVTTSAVTFSGDFATGATAAGGAIFVSQGGSLDVSGGSVSGGGSAAGNGIFIQGNDAITLTNTTLSGVIGDQSGSNLGSGAGSVVIEGAVVLGATNHYTGGTQIGQAQVAGTLTLAAPGAAGTGPISFANPSGEALIVAAGDTPTNLIEGFVPAAAGYANTDTIDLVGVGSPIGYTLSPANQLAVTGSQAAVTLNLDPAQNYSADSFVLTPDSGTGSTAGTLVRVVQSTFQVASESDLNAALASIDVSGKWAAPGISYTIHLTGGFTLSSDLSAINLEAGDTLTIDGGNNIIDGAATYRGFFDYAGDLTLENLTIENAVARGGNGGSGALPGGGGAGLGGGLFVATGAAATLDNVTFQSDQAIGGAAGSAGSGVGGGGGLGGAGGAGATGIGGTYDGGGGGIGINATGGSAIGGSGGSGIVVGAAGGIGGTGNHPVGGSGGADGGGGGASGTIETSGSGRDPRTTYHAGAAGDGGIGGGFGGGASAGNAAGFGGGGANGVGGWGGGGSGAAGGFGGGSGLGGAGGGLGAGGAVFVQQGGSLTIAGGSLTGGGVAGGQGSGNGTSGAAFGSGIFEQGNATLTFDPAAGQILSIGDVIADSAGSGDAGATGVVLSGAGTVVLSAANSYTGGTILESGTLSLQASGAAGSGVIDFRYGATAELVIGAADIPDNIISGFLPGDVIDIQGIGTATSAVPDANNVLTISGGTSTVQIHLDPAQSLNGETFSVATDHSGGTLVTASDVNGDFPPSISGTGAVTGDDHTALAPLSGVTVSDLVAGQSITVTLSLSSPLDGTLSNLSGGSYDAAHGIYTVTGSTAAVTAALDGLLFTPVEHQAAPGQTISTIFNLSATDGVMTSTAVATTVDITALDDPPAISGVTNLVEGYWNFPLNPFATATVTDPDLGAMETVTFAVSDPSLSSLSLSMPGMTLTQTGTGIYSLSAGTPAQVTSAIEALQLTTGPSTTPGYTISDVTMSVSDGIAPAVTATAEVLAGLPIFSGVASNQPVVDGNSIDPFSSVTVTDSAGLSIQGLTITLFDSSSDYLHPTDANGTLSGADLTKTGVGTYTLTPGSPSAVSAELEALVFTPADNGSTVTTFFNLAAFDGATTSDNQDTSVVASPGDSDPPLAFTTAASISGIAQEGSVLTAVNGTLNDGDAVIGYQWTLDGVAISGATASTYTVAESDEGHLIAVVETASDSDGGPTTTSTSAAVGPVIDITPTLSVTISGKPYDRSTLKANPVANDADATIKYQWQILSGGKWTNIVGATKKTFLVTEADEGARLRVIATSTDTDGTGTTAKSSATALVTDPPPSLTVASKSLTLPAGGSVGLGISVTSPDADDTVSVTIAGLTSYETITDNADSTIFSGTSVTLTAAEVNSGLTLHSSFGGTSHPKNTLSVTASNTSPGETINSAKQQITVTDPPATTASSLGLLTQYMAAGFGGSSSGQALTGTPPAIMDSSAQPQLAPAHQVS